MNKEEILEDVKASMAMEDMELTDIDLVYIQRILNGENADKVIAESIEYCKEKYCPK